jgi:hypothetical protein
MARMDAGGYNLSRKIILYFVSIIAVIFFGIGTPAQAHAAGDCPINYVMMGIECIGSFDPNSGGGGGTWRPGIVAMRVTSWP